MRSLTTLSLAALLAAGTMTGAMAQTISTSPNIYVYNFNDAGASGTNSDANTAALFSVDKTYNGVLAGSTLSSNFAAANIVNFAGSTVNADGSDAAGQALALQGGGATGAIANNGDYLQATADLTGFQGINLSFAAQRTSTGFGSTTDPDVLQYSTDGTNFMQFTTFQPNLSTAGGFTTQTFDFTDVAGLANDPNAAFRIVFNGATSAGGNNRLDNLTISGTPAAVPEASTTVSFGLLLTLGLGAIAVRRRKVA